MGTEKDDNDANLPASGLLTRGTLLLRLRDQYDDAAWQEFTDAYSGYVLAVSRRAGVSPSDEKDLLQAVLLKAWKELPGFRYDAGKGRFRGWLATMTKRTVYNHHRTNSRRVDREAKWASEVAVDWTDAEVDRISDEEWQRHVAELAWRQVSESLTPVAREVFVRLTNGESPEAVAESQGVSRNAVALYKTRIRKKLVREIGRLDQGLG
jgi:RNA polymerase sigma factor (sigma-70 family)